MDRFRLIIIFLTVVLSLTQLNVVFADPPAPWYDTTWQFRKEITIDHSKVPSDLTDFPMLVSITDANLTTSAQSDGDDILFTASDGTTKLSYEIEKWDSGTSKLAAWVKVPNLSSSTDTKIFMYYGNAAAPNQQDTTGGTWRSEYKAVYHLHDDFNDSTSNNNHCINTGSTNAAGTIADAQEFDGIDDLLNCGSASSIDNIWNNGGTLSLWLEADTRGENGVGRIFQKPANLEYPSSESGGATRMLFQTNFDGGFGVWRMNNFALKFNNWQLLHQTYNSSSAANDAAFWINGTSEPVTETFTPSGTYSGDSGANWIIGNEPGGTRTWDGKFDEYRIYDGILPAAWITAEYNNQKNPATFYAVGDEEPSPPPAPWYDTTWQFRKEITIDHSKVPSDLTDFPMLVSITDANLTTSAQSDGDDILFTLSNGTTKISHEIENWNSGTGELATWVKIPALSSSANTKIYMYYGNAAAPNQQDTTGGTWRSEYKAVYHLHDDFNDSTSNNNHCINTGSTNAAGTIADAQEFDGIDDLLNCGSASSIDNIWNNGGTLSLWLEADTRGENGVGRIFQKPANLEYPSSESGGATRMLFQTNFDGGFGVWRMNNFALKFNNWQLLHQTYNSSSAANDAAFWINGTSEPVTETFTPSGTYSGDSGANWIIGNEPGGTRTWDGKFDEYRIYDGILPAAWITAEYNNQKNPATFYSIGAEQMPSSDFLFNQFNTTISKLAKIGGIADESIVIDNMNHTITLLRSDTNSQVTDPSAKSTLLSILDGSLQSVSDSADDVLLLDESQSNIHLNDTRDFVEDYITQVQAFSGTTIPTVIADDLIANATKISENNQIRGVNSTILIQGTPLTVSKDIINLSNSTVIDFRNTVSSLKTLGFNFTANSSTASPTKIIVNFVNDVPSENKIFEISPYALAVMISIVTIEEANESNVEITDEHFIGFITGFVDTVNEIVVSSSEDIPIPVREFFFDLSSCLGSSSVTDSPQELLLEIKICAGSSAITEVGVYISGEDRLRDIIRGKFSPINFLLEKLDEIFTPSGDDIVIGTNSNGLGILFNDGNGSFGAPVIIPGVGGIMRHVVTEDVNKDGLKDIIVTDHSANRVHVILAKGDGTFQPVKFFLVQEPGSQSGARPEAIVINDFDNDGFMDIVTVNGISKSISFLKNTTPKGSTTAFFAPADESQVTNNISPLFTDIDDGLFNNDDNILDVALSDHNGNQVFVMLGQGDGKFDSGTNNRFSVGSGGVPAVGAVDFTVDGMTDILALNSGPDTISLLVNHGPMGANPRILNFTVDDVVNVGGLQPSDLLIYGSSLLIANVASDDVSLMVPSGISFTVSTTIGVGSDQPTKLALGHINNDELQDIVTINSATTDKVSILLGSGGSFTFDQIISIGSLQTPSTIAIGNFD